MNVQGSRHAGCPNGTITVVDFGASPTIVAAKLEPPRFQSGFIQRPRLLARLERGLRSRITLISAPAGYGKSTLVGQWLAGENALPSAWLSLERLDSHLERFLRYVVAALRRVAPGCLTHTKGLLGAPILPSPEYLAEIMVAELSELPRRMVLVLDDYAVITEAGVHQFMDALVRKLPETLHLVILSRLDPPLPLGLWRSRYWLHQLRDTHLRLSADETRAFFRAAGGLGLSDEAIDTIHYKTEGWIVGLRLALLSFVESADPEARVRAFSGSERLIDDYLMAEALGAQPPEVREFLALTALLERFCAPLCDYLLADHPGMPDSRAMLDRLYRANLFLFPLGPIGGWYRYHHLFREWLLAHFRQLGPALSREEIWRRAGRWYAMEGLLDEALQCLVWAGDLDAAADLVGQHLHETMNRDMSRRTLARWLALFPPGAERGRLALLVALGYLRIRAWDLADLATLVAQAEVCLSAGDESASELRADVYAQKAFMLWWRGDTRGTLWAATRALELLPPQGRGLVRILGCTYRAGGLAMSGQWSAALSVLEDGIAGRGSTGQGCMGGLLWALGVIHLYPADLAAAQAQVQRALAIHRTTPLSDYWLGHIFYLDAAIAYERSRLDEAAAGFQRVIALRYQTGTRPYQEALIGLCLIAAARGDLEEAARFCAEARAFALQAQDPTALGFAESLAGRLALLGRDTAPTAVAPGIAECCVHMWLEVPSLTWGRRLVEDPALGGPDRALAYIEEALDAAESHHNLRLALSFRLLRAMTLDSRGAREAALEVLEAAVECAGPLGLVRSFIDLGPRLRTLLEALAARVGREGHLGTLLAACREDGPTPAQGSAPPPLASWEVLSNREMQVLELLAERLGNKQIATRLGVSATTIKTHTLSIYRKLGADNRRQAVAVAIRRNILPG